MGGPVQDRRRQRTRLAHQRKWPAGGEAPGGTGVELEQRALQAQAVRLGLADPGRFSELRDFVRNDPRLKLDARTEQEYFAAQASRTSDLIMYLGWPLGIAMAFGALAGMGQIMKNTGRKELALQAWQRVLDIYPMMRSAQAEVATLSEELAGEGI